MDQPQSRKIASRHLTVSGQTAREQAVYGFIKRLIGFSVGPVGGALIAFITIPLTTHFIVPGEFGKAGMFSLIQMLFVTFLYLGVDQAYTREYHETSDRLRLFQNALLVPLLFSVVLFALFCLNMNFIARLVFGSPQYHLAVLLMAVMLLSMIVERFILLSIRMEEKAFAYSIFSILIKLVILAATLIFVLFIRRDFLAVVYATAIGQMTGDLYLMIRYRRLLNFRGFHFNRLLIKRLLTFGLPLVVAASAATFLNSAGQLSLRLWSSFYELGIFTATLKIASVLSVIQSSFTNFWVPTAYRWHSEGKPMRYFQEVSEGILVVMTVLFFLVLITKPMIVYLLSPAYGSTIYSVGLLCLQPVMYTISETTTLGIVFSRKSYLNIWVSVIALIPSLVLNAWLVPTLGAIGAAGATGVAYLFFFVGRSFFSTRNWEGFSLTRHYLIMVLFFAAACINALPVPFILLINLGMLCLTLMIQTPAMKRLVLQIGWKKQ
ncbi:MAG: oligosaccharide flippase family protein [Sporolactobacillus sp.]